MTLSFLECLEGVRRSLARSAFFVFSLSLSLNLPLRSASHLHSPLSASEYSPPKTRPGTRCPLGVSPSPPFSPSAASSSPPPPPRLSAAAAASGSGNRPGRNRPRRLLRRRLDRLAAPLCLDQLRHHSGKGRHHGHVGIPRKLRLRRLDERDPARGLWGRRGGPRGGRLRQRREPAALARADRARGVQAPRRQGAQRGSPGPETHRFSRRGRTSRPREPGPDRPGL